MGAQQLTADAALSLPRSSPLWLVVTVCTSRRTRPALREGLPGSRYAVVPGNVVLVLVEPAISQQLSPLTRPLLQSDSHFVAQREHARSEMKPRQPPCSRSRATSSCRVTARKPVVTCKGLARAPDASRRVPSLWNTLPRTTGKDSSADCAGATVWTLNKETHAFAQGCYHAACRHVIARHRHLVAQT